MLCVLDASSAAGLFLPDEFTEDTDAFLRHIVTLGATAPALWQIEILNLLIMAERKKRISKALRTELADAIDTLPIVIEPPLTPRQRGEVIALADRHKLTAYDATYLELAVRSALRLATLDRALRVAAKDEGVEILEF
jgi:predicted nucleic acid-binding protein